jgi:paraquat-inducible protein A
MQDVTAFPAGTAAAEGLACCHLCYKLAPVALHDCPRCGSALHLRSPESLQRTVALLITAALLYIPANVLPIMTTDQLGNEIHSTIMGGVVLLIQMGSIPVAAVIFIASVLVPLGKLFALSWLCWSVSRRHQTSHREGRLDPLRRPAPHHRRRGVDCLRWSRDRHDARGGELRPAADLGSVGRRR